MNGRNPWLRLWYLWAVPGLLVVAALVWLIGLRAALLGRGPLLSRQTAETETAVKKLEGQAQQLEQARKSLDELQGDLGELRGSKLGAMHERLVPFLKDVVQRTQEAGLKVERVGYAAKPDEKSGLVYFAASYSVKGSYEQIRRCVYLLESSPEFVLIEGLGLRGGESAASLDVGVQLVVGTYFSDLDEELLRQLGVTEVKHGE